MGREIRFTHKHSKRFVRLGGKSEFLRLIDLKLVKRAQQGKGSNDTGFSKTITCMTNFTGEKMRENNVNKRY